MLAIEFHLLCILYSVLMYSLSRIKDKHRSQTHPIYSTPHKQRTSPFAIAPDAEKVDHDLHDNDNRLLSPTSTEDHKGVTAATNGKSLSAFATSLSFSKQLWVLKVNVFPMFWQCSKVDPSWVSNLGQRKRIQNCSDLKVLNGKSKEKREEEGALITVGIELKGAGPCQIWEMPYTWGSEEWWFLDGGWRKGR